MVSNKKKKMAFTLMDVLMAMIVVGIIALMTIPTLVDSSQEKEEISGFFAFKSLLEASILAWRKDTLCIDNVYTCLARQNLANDDCSNFDQFAKYMSVIEKVGYGNEGNSKGWLPNQTLEYNGDKQTGTKGGVSKLSTGMCRYVLLDGVTLSVDPNPAGFYINVDINGPKNPNRIGKDTFLFTLGNFRGQDVYYYPISSAETTNTVGLCSLPASNCTPDNVDPTADNGASIMTYIMLHKRLPDFKKLSETVQGFKP